MQLNVLHCFHTLYSQKKLHQQLHPTESNRIGPIGPILITKACQAPMPLNLSCVQLFVPYFSQTGLCGELMFPSRDVVMNAVTPQRHLVIPTSFTTHHEYKQILIGALQGELKGNLGVLYGPAFMLARNVKHDI